MQVSVRISRAYADQLRGASEPMLHLTEVDLLNTRERVIRLECCPAGARRTGNRYILTIRDMSGRLAEAIVDWAEKALGADLRHPRTGRLESRERQTATKRQEHSRPATRQPLTNLSERGKIDEREPVEVEALG